MKKVKGLNDEQNAQVLRQWDNNQHENHEIYVELSGQGDGLKGFLVHKGVWNPAVASSRYHASYLYYNNVRLFTDKTAIDIGTGTGLMGLVMSLGGAKNVILTDISFAATVNAEANIKKFGVQDKAIVFKGDLFEKVPTKADFIVFNHPFFGGTPPSGNTIAASMLDPGELIKRFLKEVPEYLNPGGIIMMPFYSKAGEINNPVVQGPKYGFKTTTVFRANSRTGLQTGEITIHELRLK
jgi:methylase of polypeptide subunit release factors